MTLSSAFYALTYVTIRELSASFGVFELVFFRATVGMLAMLPWLMRAGVRALRTTRTKVYAIRVVATYSGMLCWFYGLANLPLADATALMFTSPFFTVIMLRVTLGELVGARRWLAICLGFAGAMIIIRPGFATVGLATLAVLYTAVSYGASNASTRALAITENPNAVVFYMFALVVPVSLGPAVATWVMPAWADVPMILAFGILSLVSMMCMTRGLGAAPASVVMPVFYLQLPLVAILAYLWYAEKPDPWIWVGAAVICASAYYIGRAETRRARESAADRA
jgi:drug/metabolite transporter (DMT)-like permease